MKHNPERHILVCPGCERLDVASRTVCAGCGWPGPFIRERGSVALSIARLYGSSPTIAGILLHSPCAAVDPLE